MTSRKDIIFLTFADVGRLTMLHLSEPKNGLEMDERERGGGGEKKDHVSIYLRKCEEEGQPCVRLTTIMRVHISHCVLGM
jgi:hypothetical protein